MNQLIIYFTERKHHIMICDKLITVTSINLMKWYNESNQKLWILSMMHCAS